MRNLNSIPSDSRVVPSARSIVLKSGSQDTAVLLLHGYTGQTADMAYLAGRIHDRGATVHVPRLPGHGTNSGDFRESTWRDWLRRAIDEYIDMQSEYQRVMVGGLSMGGLIAVILAARFPVARLALLAPALAVSHRMVALSPLLQYLVPPFPVVEPADHDDPDQQFLATEYWNHRRPAQIASLQRLIRIARRSLPRVTAPTLTVVSRNDRTVPLHAAELVTRRCNARQLKTVELAESGHVVTDGVEKERVADEVVSWFFAPESD